MDFTEIHSQYGLQNLQNNFEMTQWIAARYQSSTTTSYGSNYSLSVDGISNGVTIPYSQPMSDITTTESDHLSAQRSTESTTPISSPVRDGKRDSYASKAKSTETQTIKRQSSSEDDTPFVTAPERSAVKAQDDATDEQAKLETPRLSVVPDIIDQTGEDHLVNDLTLAVEAAYYLYMAAKNGIKTSTWIETLMHEIQLRKQFKDDYSPSLKSDFKGMRDISKTLVLGHSPSQTRQWEDGKKVKDCRFCILNYSWFHTSKVVTDRSKFEECLVRYFHSIRQSNLFNEAQMSRVSDAVKFSLAKHGYDSALTWIQTRIRFLDSHSQLKLKETMRNRKGSDTSEGFTLKPAKLYPPVDQKLLDHINSDLQVIITRVLENPKQPLPASPSGADLTKMFYKLSYEFLRRNKGWHNENSFTSPTHFEKLEDQSGIATPSSEAFRTFQLLRRILDAFRVSYKERFPTKPRPHPT